jgi:hypothetical protein
VADTFVPTDRVRHMIAGLHRGTPRAPVTWAARMVIRAAGPGVCPRRGSNCGQAKPPARAADNCTPAMIFLHVPALCIAASFRLVANSALELVDTGGLPDELSLWHASE